jgi:two-component system KDP operon response regulator KdpE
MTQPRPLVLLVEDEVRMRKFVRITLVSSGYRVMEAASGEEALSLASAHTPDVVLLDLGLPGMDGFEVALRIREWSPVPIIVLSARGQEQDKVRALNEGADDYLTKPFGPAELVARVAVALRHATRSASALGAVIVSGDLRIDLARRIVSVHEEEVHLTPIEYKLLAALAKHAGMVLTQQQLVREVWGPGAGHQAQSLRVHMAQLRRKLEEDSARPRHLVTEPGVGYRLKLAPEKAREDDGTSRE